MLGVSGGVLKHTETINQTWEIAPIVALDLSAEACSILLSKYNIKHLYPQTIDNGAWIAPDLSPLKAAAPRTAYKYVVQSQWYI